MYFLSLWHGDMPSQVQRNLRNLHIYFDSGLLVYWKGISSLGKGGGKAKNLWLFVFPNNGCMLRNGWTSACQWEVVNEELISFCLCMLFTSLTQLSLSWSLTVRFFPFALLILSSTLQLLKDSKQSGGGYLSVRANLPHKWSSSNMLKDSNDPQMVLRLSRESWTGFKSIDLDSEYAPCLCLCSKF